MLVVSRTLKLVVSLSIVVPKNTGIRALSTMAGFMGAVKFESGCTAEQLTIADVELPIRRPGEIMIRVHSSAINRADTLQRRGLYPPMKGESEILGLEAAGVVTSIDAGCAKHWTLGDKVMALLPGGGNAEYVTVDSRHAMLIPESIPIAQAGGVPEVWLTAYQLLHFVGHVKPTDRVLIHAGASGVGTAAIQLVKLVGATSYITASTQEKIDFAKSLGATDGFNYKQGDWAKEIMDATEGKGVTLILDCVGGSYWQQNTDILSTDGRWVLYGLMGGANIEGPLLRKLLSKRIQILPSTLKSRDKEYKAELISSFESNILQDFDSGKLKPIIETSFKLEEIGKAHALMESNKTIGKILIEVMSTAKGKDEL